MWGKYNLSDMTSCTFMLLIIINHIIVRFTSLRDVLVYAFRYEKVIVGHCNAI